MIFSCVTFFGWMHGNMQENMDVKEHPDCVVSMSSEFCTFLASKSGLDDSCINPFDQITVFEFGSDSFFGIAQIDTWRLHLRSHLCNDLLHCSKCISVIQISGSGIDFQIWF